MAQVLAPLSLPLPAPALVWLFLLDIFADHLAHFLRVIHGLCLLIACIL